MRKLTVNEILPLLEGATKAGAGYKAKCPLHPDNNASLSINEDSTGAAIINCFAGCDQGALWRYLRDKAGKTENKPRAVLANEYEYKNASGVVIDVKQRYQPGFNGAKKSFLWKIKSANRREVLPPYNLAAILNAPQDEIIYLVEGEKDVNTLRARGIVASSTRDGITEQTAHYFAGRSLAIIADNDKAGIEYATKAAAILAPVAGSVKVINTPDYYEGAPAKSDITDFLNSGGDLAAVSEAIARAPIFSGGVIPSQDANADKHPLAVYYDNVPNCYISDNTLVYKNGDNITPLCFGALAIKSEITKNNGVENNIYFEVLAATPAGDLLAPCIVSASEFNSLNWIIKNYGARVAIAATQSAKQKLITAVTLTGLNCERRRVYSHFGYIYKNDKPVNYLHFGGDLLEDNNSQCEIDNNLRRYNMLTPGNTEENRTAVNKSLLMLRAHAPAVVYPLLSFVYLAPLMPIVKAVLGDIGFLFYLQGETQGGKSTLAALACSHYGNFTRSTPPASFLATANAINELAFILKDCILWIDDFYPKENPAERKKITGIFQNLARAAGDTATRARLNSDSRLKTNHPPRCLFLVTGEDNPDIGKSGAARVFSVYVPSGIREDITEIQTAGRSGDLARAMACYIRYIIDNFEDVKSNFEYIYNICSEDITADFGAVRLSNQAALLSASLIMFLKYAVVSGAITSENAKQIKTEGLQYIKQAARDNENNIRDTDPVNIYIRALSDLIAAGRVSLIDLDINTPATSDFMLSDKNNIIGYKDKLYIYLDSNLAYKAVYDYQAGENAFFGISKATIQRQLLERGYICGKDNNPTITKTINKRSVRLLRFRRDLLAPSGDQGGAV